MSCSRRICRASECLSGADRRRAAADRWRSAITLAAARHPCTPPDPGAAAGFPPACWCSPETAGRDPACYKLTDAVLLEGVEDFESREQLWEVLGRDNLAAVRGVITAAARLDRRYCGQVHALALLSRARRLVQEGQGEQLAELLREEDSLALVRDLEGRSLWHDLVVAGGGQGEELLLRLLLPIAAAAAAAEAAGAPGGDAAAAPGGEEGQEEQGEQDAKQQGGQQEPHFLDLADAGGNTPLHLAAEAAQLEAARLLIDAGASVNLQNRWAQANRRRWTAWNVPAAGSSFIGTKCCPPCLPTASPAPPAPPADACPCPPC